MQPGTAGNAEARSRGGAQAIFTIGHSRHPLERFVELLQGAGVEVVADVRSRPRSRFPHFARGELARELERRAGIGYVHLPELGGFRDPLAESPNTALRERAFRGYADHMQSPEFASGLSRLLALARTRRVTVMCAESDWRRCHRRMVADALAVRGVTVVHLLPDGGTERHVLDPRARVVGGRLVYPVSERAPGEQLSWPA